MRAVDVRAGIRGVLTGRGLQHLVHVGAHEGEEVPDYRAAGIGRITLVEPIPELAQRLRTRYPDVTVVQAACSDRDGHAVLHIPARTQMASLAELDGRTVPVHTMTLSRIAPDADAAVIDVQGHEKDVLYGAPWLSLQLVVVETCTVDDPTVAAGYDDVVSFMSRRSWVELTHFARPYDFIQRWAYGRRTQTGGEVRDVVFVRA